MDHIVSQDTKLWFESRFRAPVCQAPVRHRLRGSAGPGCSVCVGQQNRTLRTELWPWIGCRSLRPGVSLARRQADISVRGSHRMRSGGFTCQAASCRRPAALWWGGSDVRRQIRCEAVRRSPSLFQSCRWSDAKQPNRNRAKWPNRTL